MHSPRGVARALNKESNLIKRRRRVPGLGALDAQRRLLQRDDSVRLDAVREPDAGADDRVMADDAFAAEDRGVGVDDDVVLERWMALHAADDVAGGVAREAQGA